MAPQEQQRDVVTAAIERVLKAERDGVEALRGSEGQARELLAQARAQAGAIGRRTDTCIAKLHAAYLKKIQRDIEALAGPAADAGGRAPYDQMALRAAARRVAAKLTGGA